MLPARYRMTRSTEFSTTVSQGVRSAHPDLVLHGAFDAADDTGPRIGLVVSKSVGNAVMRHRVSRRLRHASRTLLDDLDSRERLVIRALPNAGRAISPDLERQLRDGLARVRRRRGTAR
ncbi:ribonuclease P protein component [Mycobacterium sp. NPDC050041]|uniref:ribonuclease P protein component n=1 Tax=Mycobacterium sp. NPDC050041 TaxID=3364293 RepID=UPI003C2D219F